MTTLTSLIQQVRYLTGDTSITPNFSDAEITAFINLAIADISTHFPRRIAYSLTTVDSQHAYDLEIAHLAILSCEYPSGALPPYYLQRLSRMDTDFWGGGSPGFYDVIQPNDADSGNPPQIIISPGPPDDAVITLWLVVEHNRLSNPADVTSILDRHHHLIGLFCRWKMWHSISLDEALDPNPLNTFIQNQEINAQRAEQAYLAALQAAQAASASSAPTRWRMDAPDRVY